MSHYWLAALLIIPLSTVMESSGCGTTEPTPTPPPETPTLPPETPTQAPDQTFDIRVMDLGYANTYIHHDDGAGWTTSPGDKMTVEGSWRHYTRNIDSSLPYGSTFTFTDGGSLWYPGGVGNNFRVSEQDVWIQEGLMYTHDLRTSSKPANELALLTINLHTYQESDQDAKLNYVVDVIAALPMDLVALQECAQSKDAAVVGTHYGVQIRSDNMAMLIVDRLKTRYGLEYGWYWDWAHYGFDVYEEGVAVLAPTGSPLLRYGSAYVSSSTSIYDPLGSRKAVFGVFDVPGFGELVLMSAHISWGSEQNKQIDNLRSYLEAQLTSQTKGAFIAGDFNADAGGTGYTYMVSGSTYLDTYVAANAALKDNGLHDATTDDGSRIDYIFQNRNVNPALRPITSQRVFLDLKGGGQGHSSLQRVSDHRGVVVRFRQ